jgi:SET domain-containing protein
LDKKGIGVFAIRRIPKGVKVFTGENEEILWTNKDTLPKRGPLRKLYDDFCIIKDQRYGSPTNFNRLTVAWFLNESKKPNIACDDNYEFTTIRSVKAGEELTVDYSTFSEYPK